MGYLDLIPHRVINPKETEVTVFLFGRTIQLFAVEESAKTHKSSCKCQPFSTDFKYY